MDLSTFIISVFCLVDDRLKGRSIRSRGPAPKLSDAEVLTIEVVGEFLGIDTDKGIYLFFRRHYSEWFPALSEVHRTTFARQAANLWKLKERLWQELLGLAPTTQPLLSATLCPCRLASLLAPTAALASKGKRPSARTRCSGRPSTASVCTLGSAGLG